MARSRPPSAGQIPLAHLFEVTYLPIKLRNGKASYADIFRGAINWLRKALAREPLVADLTRPQLALTFKTMAAAGIGKSRLSEVRKRLVQLWQFSAALGMAGPPDPPPIRAAGKLPARPWLDMQPAPGTLLFYYRQEFRPRLEAEADHKRCMHFDSAINHFHDVAQTHVVLDTITEFTLADFFAALIRMGKTEDYAKQHRGAIARIVRTIDPQRFPVLPGPEPKLLAGERAKREAQPPAEPGTLRHLYETVYLPQRLLGASYHTFNAYRRLFSLVRSFLGGREALVSELTDAFAAGFFNWLADTETPGTINRRRAELFALWRVAYDRDQVPRLPRVKKLKVDLEEPDAWSAEEMGQIVAATSRLARKPIHGVPAGPYWRALLLVTWYTAMRRRSLFSLRIVDVDLARGTIYARAAGVKTKKGKRYKIGPDALDAIRAIWDPGRDKLFPKPSHPNKHFAELLNLAGIKDSEHRLNQFHKVRRTSATQAAIAGGMPAAMNLLDHSTVQMTRRYVDTTQLPANDATQFLPRLTSNPQEQSR